MKTNIQKQSKVSTIDSIYTQLMQIYLFLMLQSPSKIYCHKMVCWNQLISFFFFLVARRIYFYPNLFQTNNNGYQTFSPQDLNLQPHSAQYCYTTTRLTSLVWIRFPQCLVLLHNHQAYFPSLDPIMIGIYLDQVNTGKWYTLLILRICTELRKRNLY